MSGTPRYSKSVRFASNLEQVRFFMQDDSALAFGIESLAIGNWYGLGNRRSATIMPYKLKSLMSEVLSETPAPRGQAVLLECVWLSNDGRLLFGTVSVLNLVFEKRVRCRFTIDEWNTASEVAAEYVCEIRPKELLPGYDRFAFCIETSSFADLDSKALYFCVRYYADGQEYWDNNGGKNFRVDFQEIILSHKGNREKDPRYTTAINTSSWWRVHPPTGTIRSKGPEGFKHYAKLSSHQTIRDYFKELEPNNRNGTTLQKGLHERYDFDESLFAAMRTERRRLSKREGPVTSTCNQLLVSA